MSSKGNIKSFIVVGICSAIVTTTALGFASEGVKKSISVVFNNIKLVVDGKSITFGNDSDGKKIEPFIYNGTTYLPVRAVGESLNKKVDWDGKSQTVYIGEIPDQEGKPQYITEVLDAVSSGTTYNLGNTNRLKMGGKTYTTGHSSGNGSIIYFNLDSQYTEVEGEIGSLSLSGNINDVNIFLDEKLYKSIEITGSKSPEKVTIPVTGVNQLKFQRISRPGNWSFDFGLGDFIIK